MGVSILETGEPGGAGSPPTRPGRLAGLRNLRLTPRAYRRITFAALVALVVIVVTGAAVRLTGSGLGCPDWPRCTDTRFRAEASFHQLVEFSNRMFTGTVSVAVIAAVAGALIRVPRRRDLTWLSMGLVLGVLAQIVLGGVTVLTDLSPPIVAAHFLLSMVLIANALLLHLRAGTDDHLAAADLTADHLAAVDLTAPGRAPDRALRGPVDVRVRRITAGLVVLASVVLVTGTVVTGAGPHGGDENVRRLDLGLEAVARVHSLAVWLLVAATLFLVTRLRVNADQSDVRSGAALCLWVMGCQGAIGYLQYASDVPAGLVLTHVLGATLVWLSVVRLWFVARKAAGACAA
jgi:heme a synthase